jgi:hypothetical protein
MRPEIFKNFFSVYPMRLASKGEGEPEASYQNPSLSSVLRPDAALDPQQMIATPA